MAMRTGRSRHARRHQEQRAAQKLPELLGYSPLEKEIAGDVIKALRRISCDVSSTQQPRASMVTEGIPDLWVTHAAWGVYCWMELKRPGEEPKKHQHEWHEKTRAAGCPVLVVTSAEEAIQQFAALPRRR